MRAATTLAVPSTEQILGVRFFNGSVDAAVSTMCECGGLLVVPAAPALVHIRYDEGYRRALVEADLAIADSGAMVLLWKILRHRKITRISGLAYLKRLLQSANLREPGRTFLVLPTNRALDKALQWLGDHRHPMDTNDCYVAPHYSSNVRDAFLVETLNARRPNHIIVAIGGGVQEKLGLYLKENCDYVPAIHCIGAALGFLTGDQQPIPDWADKLYLGWLLRLLRNPRLYARRFWLAHELPGLIAKYGERLPPLRKA